MNAIREKIGRILVHSGGTPLLLALVAAVLPGFAPLSAAAGDGLVADPYRAVEVTWPKHACKGQDYRFMLYRQMLDLADEKLQDGKLMKDEPFFREAGIADVPSDESFTGGDRRIEIRSVKCRDAEGNDVEAELTVKALTRGALIEKTGFGTVVTAPRLDTFERYRGICARLALKAERPIASVTVDSPDLDAAQRTRKFASPKDTVAFDVRTPDSRLVVKGISLPEKYRARLETAPFMVYPKHRGHIGLDPKNVDLTGYRQLAEKYPEGFLGTDFGEWDAMFLYRLARPYCARTRELNALGPFPCDRAGIRRNLKAFWDTAKSQMGPRIFGMTAAGLDSYGPEWGGTICCAELTDNREKPYRNMVMRMRGAVRQFDVPMYIYTAYFRNSNTCDSRPARIKASNGVWGVDFGREPSLSLREHYMAYYMGNNYQSFECQPWGQMIRLEDGTLGFTGNGRAMKDVYDWYRSPKGERGESYAPILLLDEGTAGHDVLDWRHVSEKMNGGPWKCSYPANDADFLEKYVMESITPYYDPDTHKPWDFTPDFSSNMRNSTLGDIFDVYVGTPVDRRQEPTEAQLGKYPVVLALHDLRWTESLANSVKRYVANGGTFVATVAQVAPFADDPEFLGISSVGAGVADGDLLVDQVTLAGAEVVERSAEGRPLILKKDFHGGNVVLVTSPFFRKVKDRDAVPAQLLRLLETLQAETVPFRVKGLCEAMYNRCADGSWRVVLINNSGVQKKSNTSDDPKRPEFAAKLELTVPAGATAEEIRLGAALTPCGTDAYAITVPPGEVCVVKVEGVKGLAARKVAAAEPKPVTPFGALPYLAAIRNDGYLYSQDAGKVRTPDVIGEWKGENGFRDSSPQGHDMKLLNGAKVVDGRLVTDVPMAVGEVKFDCDYAIREATYDMYVTPSADAKKGGVFAKASYCGVADVVRIDIVDGCWELLWLTERWGRETRRGPKLEPRRTRLTVTIKDGFVRFYVDGKEVTGPRGPVKLADSPEARDDFYKSVNVLFGASTPHPGYNFPGTCESLRFTSKAIVP